ncbi:isocitrate/isopropylmalate dehydrogenase family protein [Humitalea sp. 24SJ18S-53]|uniref:isocitrate/isopropylmalate dehydrogenase family protein n=1 Tax=Humitalea sp. 24SJ18S-53 TaxID=3422307 RepID=UPI003D67E98D
MQIIVLPGDGIGPEITTATLAVLRATEKAFGLKLDLVEEVIGLESHRLHGTTVRPHLLDQVRAADGMILGPTSTFDYAEGTSGQYNPSRFFRRGLDLFANIRPARTFPGMPARLGAFDLVVVRENTEGFYADRNMEAGNAEILVTPDVVVSLRRITRSCCMRIAQAAFELAQRRQKRVTAVHKANVLRVGDGMFLECCRLVAQDFPDVVLDEVIVDAMMAHVVRAPQRFDVIVTTNMFGDILSDLTAEMSGSLGLGGSLNAGTDCAMAQAAHGSAPDIAGRDIANPISLILSAALLLSWHGRRGGGAEFVAAGAAIEAAVAESIAAGASTKDLGGSLGTQAAGAAIAERVRRG